MTESNPALANPTGKVQPIRPAATVIIIRDGPPEHPSGYEIFMLKRSGKSSFAGGMYVFPGGKVDPDDHLHALDDYRVGPTEVQANQQAALGAEWRGYWIAGIRECLEEAALLLAYDESGQLVGFDDKALHDRMEADRHALHQGDLDMVDICRREGFKLAVDQIHFLNRFVTPIGRPRRFDTRFFVAKAPPSQLGLHDDVETVGSEWIAPSEALERNAAGEFDLMRVTQLQLQGLCGFDSAEALIDDIANRDTYPVTRPPTIPQA